MAAPADLFHRHRQYAQRRSCASTTSSSTARWPSRPTPPSPNTKASSAMAATAGRQSSPSGCGGSGGGRVREWEGERNENRKAIRSEQPRTVGRGRDNAKPSTNQMKEPKSKVRNERLPLLHTSFSFFVASFLASGCGRERASPSVLSPRLAPQPARFLPLSHCSGNPQLYF